MTGNAMCVPPDTIRDGVWSGDESTVSGMHPRSDGICLEWRAAEALGPCSVLPIGPRRRSWARFPVVTQATLNRRVRMFARAAHR